MRMGNYKVCQVCGGAIHKNGKMIYKSIGLGFRKVGKSVHTFCYNRITKGKVIKVKENNQTHFVLC